MVSFAYWWVILAVGSLPLIMLMEYVATVMKGPEFMLWVRKNRKDSESKLGPLGMTLFWMGFWWVILIMWARAAWKGRTLMEHFILKQHAKQEEMAEMARNGRTARWRLVNAIGGPQGKVWFAPYIKDFPYQPYIRAEAKMASLICTHFIVFDPTDDECIVLRMGQPMEGDPPTPDTSEEGRDYTCHDLAEATQWCENDTRWNELCLTGTDQQRDLFRRGLLR